MPASEKVGNKEITGAIEDVLKALIGAARHEWWFAQDIKLDPQEDALVVHTTNRFMVDRVRRSLLKDLQQAALQVYGSRVSVQVQARTETTTAVEAETRLEPETPVATGNPVETTNSAAIKNPAETQNPAANTARVARRTPTSRQPSSTRQPSLSGLKDHEIDQGSDRNRPLDGKAGGAQRPTRSFSSRRASQSPHDEPRKLISDVGPRGKASSKPADSDANHSVMAMTSLDNFCVGPCNTLAHMAATMAANQPGSPSPLFFWGPAGTGKTHLLAALRNVFREQHRLRRVVLLSAEQFTNDFTGAVRGSGLPAFRRRYRDVDALLIDDVQFVGGKRATLRELLYTVDSLLRGRCQLAFTADRPPLELEGLNEELAGRMAGGMVCPLRPLDRETRLAVLKRLAEVSRTVVDEGVLESLADELVGDGRILSGAFNHLRTLGAMLGRPANWDELLSSAPDLIAAGRPAVNLGDIQKAVCDMFGLPAGSLASRGQHRSVSQPRMLAMYLARQYTRAAYSEIGQFFGDRSHSTVIAATKRVEGWISENKPLRRGPQSLAPQQAIEAIENLLRTG